MNPEPASNFSFLKAHDVQLVRLGLLAERYFADDPNTCLLKLRQLVELLAQLAASRVGIFTSSEEKKLDLLRRLQDHGIVPREVGALLHEVRRAGNDANHKLADDHRTALLALRLTWQLSVWFHRTFNDQSFKSGPFLPPVAPVDESSELRVELDALRAELLAFRAAHQEAAQSLEVTKAQVQQTQEERAFWESMAAEAETAKSRLSEHLAELQAKAAEQTGKQMAAFVAAANVAAAGVKLSEADTRKLIDDHLAKAGWTVDSATLTFAKGARPQRGQNLAIAEWPTETGPADYVLFVGTTPVAIVEAKRMHLDVSAALQQAKRYSRGFRTSPEAELRTSGFGEKGEFRIPFVFSSNGRPFLRQLAQQSGVWFCDVRRPENLGRVLDGWYEPEGLSALLQQDEDRAHAELANAAFEYGFPLRPYQEQAIRATEASIREGQRAILLAMATGTGKTKTCIALIYRLLKAKRFRRILFLVDRSALGEQAANAFKDTRMERLHTFADIFGIKELDEQQPDEDTAVHLATVQGMVQRVLYTAEGEKPPPIDQYDCIVVDECHRGYLLDRELSHTELSFRGYDDYVSTYRRVLDYFDAVKVGLTATPALHTTQIFGAPVFTYLKLIEDWTGIAAEKDHCHIVLTSHNPLTIAALSRDEVRVISTDAKSNAIVVEPPFIDPRGLGIGGVLTDIFGMPSTLDQPTQDLIAARNRLARLDEPTADQLEALDAVNEKLRALGFMYEERDELYRKFLRRLDAVEFTATDPRSPAELQRRELMMSHVIEELLRGKA